MCARPPTKRGADVMRDRLEHRGVVVDAELAWHGEEDRVGDLDGGVSCEFLGDLIGSPEPKRLIAPSSQPTGAAKSAPRGGRRVRECRSAELTRGCCLKLVKLPRGKTPL
jgi:hypothetical protein